MKKSLEEKIIKYLFYKHALIGYVKLPGNLTGDDKKIIDDYFKLENRAQKKGMHAQQMSDFKKLLRRWKNYNMHVRSYNIAVYYLILNDYIKCKPTGIQGRFDIYQCKLLEKGYKKAAMLTRRKEN